MHFSISRIREVINRERIYVLMLSFIISINAWLIFAEKIPGMKEGFVGRRIFGLRLAERIDHQDEDRSQTPDKISLDELLQKGLSWPVYMLAVATMFFLCLGLFLDISILMAKIRKREIIETKVTHLAVGWGISDIFKLGIIFIFIGYLIRIIETQTLPSFLEKEGIMRFILLLNMGIMDLLLLGFIIYFIKVKFGQGLAAIGLKIKGALKNIFLGFLSYIAFLPALLFLFLLILWLASVFQYQPPEHVLSKLFLQEKRTWLLVYLTILLVIVGPIVEEVFFRGFAYNAIKRKWGISSAMALTAIVFAGLHINLIGFLPIMMLGFLLAYMYEKTGSLISSITIHMIHNALTVGFLFSGRYLTSLIQ